MPMGHKDMLVILMPNGLLPSRIPILVPGSNLTVDVGVSLSFCVGLVQSRETQIIQSHSMVTLNLSQVISSLTHSGLFPQSSLLIIWICRTLNLAISQSRKNDSLNEIFMGQKGLLEKTHPKWIHRNSGRHLMNF